MFLEESQSGQLGEGQLWGPEATPSGAERLGHQIHVFSALVFTKTAAKQFSKVVQQIYIHPHERSPRFLTFLSAACWPHCEGDFF